MSKDQFNSPIILIGAARSGTKFLRDCLAASPDCRAVPYDINYIWRYGQEALQHDILDADVVSNRIKSFIRKTVPKLSKAQAQNKIIEKTVSNTLRVPFVNEIYPNAIFVHLIRDGREVVESAMRQWTDPPDKRALIKKLRSMPIESWGYVIWYASNILTGLIKGNRKGGDVWGPRYPGIKDDAKNLSLVEVCAKQWKACVEKSLKDLSAIDPSRVHTIRYQDFISNGDFIIDLAKKLNLSNPNSCAKAMQNNVRKSKSSPAWTELSQEDIEVIEKTLSETLIKLGYN